MDFMILWVLISTCLVFLMQAGFGCLEAGTVRTKNSTNVAIKNIADFTICFIIFWFVGYGIIFGVDHYNGLMGLSDFMPGATERVPLSTSAHFLFHAMFASTAATIFSGAVAERLRFRGFLLISLWVSLAIYPFIGHWVWNENGWLAKAGVYDFAGVLVVHSVGGWVALAMLLVVGARHGRFKKSGAVKDILPFNLPLAMLGIFLLAFGWIGFNSGSAKSPGEIGYIIINTFIGGTFGVASMIVFNLFQNKPLNVTVTMNGFLAGLVAVTGCANIIFAWHAAIIGFTGGLVMLGMRHILFHFRIDDAIDAVPVHLGAGIWGAIAIALFGDLEHLPAPDRLTALSEQFNAILSTGFWAFGLTYAFASTVNKIIPLRVTPHDERQGLNISEHGQEHPMNALINTMQIQARTGDMSLRVNAEPFTELEEIAFYYNQALSKIQMITDGLEDIVESRTNALAKEKEKALHASEAKSLFLANMSHELRTPLNSIIGMTKIAQNYQSDPEQIEMIHTAHRASQILLEIVNDILDISKIESNNIALEKIGFDFNVIVERAVTTLRPLQADKNNTLILSEKPMAMPYILGDPLRVNGIITNLISNALKYTENGEIKVNYHYKDLPNNKVSIYCEVIDDGIGIASDKQALIFENFSQADVSTTRKFGGTGLGLAITKQLVELMGGKIGVESTLGSGATFWFEIPFTKTKTLSKDSHAREGEAVYTDRVYEDKIPSQQIRLLVAEDNQFNIITLEKLLVLWDIHNIEFVENGIAAVDAVRKQQFDLILMDCHMPEMNGYDATKVIRDMDDPTRNNIPIISLTADVVKGTKEKCLEVGMDAYASKPIDPDVFKSLLSHWIDFTGNMQKKQDEPTSFENNEHLDLTVIKQYADDYEDLEHFIQLFCEQAKKDIAVLEKNRSNGENLVWSEAAHRLKGSSSTIGALHLHELCRKAQDMVIANANARKKIFDDIQDSFSKAEERFEEALKYEQK